MAKNSSARARRHTPHVLEISRTNTIMNALKRRALAVLNDESLDAQSRAIIRYALETNDPWLADLVKRADAGESIADTFDSQVNALEFSEALDTSVLDSQKHGSTQYDSIERDSSEDKVEVLTNMICGAGDELTAALFVLMGTLESSVDPGVLANTAKQVCLHALRHAECSR
jgi:hypothetical protein